MSEIPIAALDQIVRQQERIADLEKERDEWAERHKAQRIAIVDSMDKADAALAKLAKCREALELIIRVNSNTDSENKEDGLPDIHDIAEQALEQTK